LTELWTIGHGTRALDDLIALLRAHDIRRLVDVRTIPRSRRNPQFDRDMLARALPAAHIVYAHAPALGGLRRPRRDSTNTGWRNAGFRGYADYMETSEFATALEALLVQAAGDRVAVMCAESVPWRCHRSLIADAATLRGAVVRHIIGRDRALVHAVTPWARVEGTRLTYPKRAGGATATGA
jgi:uncharacterized protein (DUF488 family)